MTDAHKPILVVCVVCGQEKECTHSLRLSRVDGIWKSNPVCKDDRTALIRQAKSEGKFIPFYTLATSEQEVSKRNEESDRLGKIVSRYGYARNSKGEPFNKATLKLRAKSGKL
jgi:hypothetical protein